MKEIDDTEIQVEADFADLLNTVAGLMFEIEKLEHRLATTGVVVDQIVRRVANLEARKPPQDTNPDPEWFS